MRLARIAPPRKPHVTRKWRANRRRGTPPCPRVSTAIVANLVPATKADNTYPNRDSRFVALGRAWSRGLLLGIWTSSSTPRCLGLRASDVAQSLLTVRQEPLHSSSTLGSLDGEPTLVVAPTLNELGTHGLKRQRHELALLLYPQDQPAVARPGRS